MSEPERPLNPNDPDYYAPPRLRQRRQTSSAADHSERNSRQIVAMEGKQDAFAEAIAKAVRAQLEAEAERMAPQSQLLRRPKAKLRVAIGFAVGVFGAISYVALQSPSLGLQGLHPWSTLAAWQAALSSPPADGPRRSLLMLSDQSGLMNEPLQLGVRVGEQVLAGNVLVKGVPDNAFLTTGVPIRHTEWRIKAGELAETRIIPPVDFVGELNLTAELLDTNGAAIVAGGWHLTWKPTTRIPAATSAVADAKAEMPEPVKPLAGTRQIQAEPQQLAMVSPQATTAKDEKQKSGQSLPTTPSVPAPARPDGPETVHGGAPVAGGTATVMGFDAIEHHFAITLHTGQSLQSQIREFHPPLHAPL